MRSRLTCESGDSKEYEAQLVQHQTQCELVYRHLQFHELSQQFISPDDETLSVAMRVHNPDCAPSESTPEAEPQLHPALLRLSALIS